MIEIIQERLARYDAANPIEEEHATKQILQEIALYALWRAAFFDVALFQGGTSLRILHGLPRFSEDLDFMLTEPDPKFDWTGYFDVLSATLEEFGLRSEIAPKGRLDKRIRQAVIKDNSVVNQLDLSFYNGPPGQKIKLKLEIDVEPPAHSGEAYTFLDCPLDFEVRHQDLPSNFSLKIHALLCRGFVKGRDWFDFSWYVARGVYPNLPHLEAALRQFGPWSNDASLKVDAAWLEKTLADKIADVDWRQAAEDVRRFLRPAEEESLKLWGERFFAAKLSKLLATANATE